MIRTLLAGALLLAPGLARAEWHEASTDHFVILSDDKPENLSAYALALERYDKAMRVFRNIPDHPIPPVDRVVVYVTATTAGVERLSQPGVAGFYVPNAGRSVAFTARKGDRDNPGAINPMADELMLDPQAVLRHEYAHHFMYNSWPAAALPLWLTEGFAEFHATAETKPDGSILFGRVPRWRVLNFEFSENCSTRRIVTTGDFSKLQEVCSYSDIYAHGWLTTHYLTFAEGGPQKMSAYIRALNSGEPLEKAATAFGDLNAFQTDVTRYLNLPTRTVYTVPASKLTVKAPVIRKLRQAEVDTMAVRMRSQAGVDKNMAPGVFTAAKRAAAPWPNDPVAQLVLAEAAFDAKDYAVTQKAAAAVLAAEPKSSKAMIYMGRARMEEAAKAKSTDPAVWKEVRRWFLLANKADPDDAEALILYYQSFLMAGEAPTRNAKDGLLQAAQFAPHDRSLPFLSAYVHLTDNKLAEARTALRVIAYAPHAGRGAWFATRMLALIDKGDVAGASAKMLVRIRNPEYRDADDEDPRKKK